MMDIDDGEKKRPPVLINPRTKERLTSFRFPLSTPLDQVTRVSRNASLSESATSPPDTDVEMEDREPEPEPEPKPKPTRKTQQRKPKREVPVGRNGLKKKRVVKSRMTTDAKGYFGAYLHRLTQNFLSLPVQSLFHRARRLKTHFGGFARAVTEDYSSYESVDEEEAAAAPPEKPTKAKGKKAAAAAAPIAVKNESEAEEKVVKAPAKGAASSTLKRKPSKPSVQKGGIASYFSKK